MDFEKAWNNALRNTEIIRSRVQALMTHADTRVPYILLCESTVNLGDTVVRQGEVLVNKPSIIVPPNNPQFKGFDFEQNPFQQNNLVNFLLVRGISMPSMYYDNKTHSLDIFEGKMSKAIEYYQDLLQKQENVQTGLLTGPEDYWQFSLLVFICSQIIKNADQDIRRLMEEYRKKEDQ
ncbi:MAG: hypothetical protein H6755_06170 [Candidatus Omnitrophica bacterium]|nr:hypothetical protein [Candidatus Omnitrophota bacterium]